MPTAREVAESFLYRASLEGESLTQMKLQKLVYISHGWNLAILGRELFPDRVEAWDYGPVIPALRSAYRAYGASGIDSVGVNHPFDKATDLLLGKVWDAYKKFTAAQLSALTHQPGTPWSECFRPGRKGIVIPNEKIRQHYLALSDAK